MAAPPKVGWVRLSSSDPPVVLVARLSEDRPNVEQGYGGWDEVSRPRRKTLTTWRGSPALKMTLGLLLDGFREHQSVEPQIAQLQRLGTPSSAAGEPPVVRLQATGNAIPYQARPWVIADMGFGDAIMNRAGNRTRQAVTLTLLEHVVDVYLTQKAAAAQRKAKVARAKTKHGAAEKRITASRAPKRTTAKKAVRAVSSAASSGAEFGAGEDLLTIAARELGDADRWVEIAQLNGLRDPRAIAVGQVLRLP